MTDIYAIALAAALLFLTLNPACAQERNSRFEIEAGVITTQNMQIQGYNQGNATEGWKKSGADLRVEYWSTRQKGLELRRGFAAAESELFGRTDEYFEL